MKATVQLAYEGVKNTVVSINEDEFRQWWGETGTPSTEVVKEFLTSAARYPEFSAEIRHELLYGSTTVADVLDVEVAP